MKRQSTLRPIASALVFVVAGLVLVLPEPKDARAAELEFPSAQWRTGAQRRTGAQWRTGTDEETVGWDRAKLEAAIDFAMSRKSSSVVVVHAGRIIAERHEAIKDASRGYAAMRPGRTSDGHATEDVASVQKSVVCLLVGIAIDKELVTLDDPVQKHLGVGWSKADEPTEAAITLRHLVTMTSGLNTKLEFVAEPGSRWMYNTNAYAKSLACLQAVTNKSANDLTREWLLDPIGMSHSRWQERGWLIDGGADANRLGFVASARDLSRFGLLVLAGGRWKSTPIVSETYLHAALHPSQELNPSYGFYWWLNGESHAIRGRRKVEGPIIDSAPDDLVAALGALGRKCYVVPSLDLVVVRLGDSPERSGAKSFDREFWRLLMLAKSE